MKTNILFVCQFCQKKLSSKRTVRMHIKNLHKEDPENPVKYDQILVSPKEVNKLLTAETAGDGKTSDRVVLAAIPEDFVNVDVIEPVEDIRPAIAEPDLATYSLCRKDITDGYLESAQVVKGVREDLTLFCSLYTGKPGPERHPIPAW